MTTIIDHAIAIPTKHRNVWEQLGDISKNSIWQADSERITFLTTMHTGKGTRWRNAMPNGKEYVIEITAWYEGLGYEYIIADGMPFTGGKGRIRLQDAPEGTIVQWTFSYEMPGFLGSIRNTLGIRRSVDSNVVNSLRNLYSYIKELKADEAFSVTDSKALLRDAPDVESRLQYQPRHPSVLQREEAEPPAEQEPVQEIPGDVIIEPAIAEDDTRPNPTATPASEAALPPEPSFIPALSVVKNEKTVPEFAESGNYKSPDKEDLNLQPQAQTLAPLLPGIEDIDTGRVSVFELFGLQKPSETEQIRTIRNLEQQSPAAEARIIPDVTPPDSRRRGLRNILRERIAKVRIPTK